MINCQKSVKNVKKRLKITKNHLFWPKIWDLGHFFGPFLALFWTTSWPVHLRMAKTGFYPWRIPRFTVQKWSSYRPSKSRKKVKKGVKKGVKNPKKGEKNDQKRPKMAFFGHFHDFVHFLLFSGPEKKCFFRFLRFFWFGVNGEAYTFSQNVKNASDSFEKTEIARVLCSRFLAFQAILKKPSKKWTDILAGRGRFFRVFSVFSKLKKRDLKFLTPPDIYYPKKAKIRVKSPKKRLFWTPFLTHSWTPFLTLKSRLVHNHAFWGIRYQVVWIMGP